MKAEGQQTRRKRDHADQYLRSVSANIEVAAMTDYGIFEYYYRQAEEDEYEAFRSLIVYFAHVFNLVSVVRYVSTCICAGRSFDDWQCSVD